MSAVAALRPGPEPADAGGWVAWLQAEIDGSWRLDEWNPARWLFRGDADNPKTRLYRCATPGCANVTRLSKRRRCSACVERAQSLGLGFEEFLSVGDPPQTRRPPRPARSADEQCLVASCDQVAGNDGMCHWHQSRRQESPGVPIQQWATTAPPWLGLGDFWLGGLPTVLRHEVLFAVQQRDRRPCLLSPESVRRAIFHLESGPHRLGGVSLLDVDLRHVESRWSQMDHPTAALLQELTHAVRFEHDRFAEVDPTDGDVWNTWQVGLATRPGKGRRVTKSFLHFAPIRQVWLRDLTKRWVADTMPTVENAQRTIRAVSVASTGLATRPGGGHDRTVLGGADMAAAFAALRDGRLVGGELASVRLRQRLIRLFFALIDFGRRTDLLADVPGAFAQLREHVLPDVDVTEDHLGRAIPESIIRYLDQHLDLLGCRSSGWLAVEPTR